MKFGLVSRVDRNDAINKAKEVLEFLENEGEKVEIEEKTAKKIGKEGIELKEMNVDILITIGGDGTTLNALHNCRAKIFGINAGITGFLTEVGLNKAIEGLERVLKGDYFIDKRMRLRTLLNNSVLPDSVNEAVIHTAHVAKLRHFKILVDGRFAEEVRADGIIVATPTGSTCYAMSAGSPILDPRVPALVIVPIAPFALSSRALVVPAESEIKIKLYEFKPCMLVLDGQFLKKIEEDFVIKFTASKNYAEFIRFSTDFYKRVWERLVV